MRVSQYFIGDGLKNASFVHGSHHSQKASEHSAWLPPFQTAIFRRLNTEIKALWQQMGGLECASYEMPPLTDLMSSLCHISFSHKQLPLLFFCEHMSQQMEACGLYLNDSLRDEAMASLKRAFASLLEACRLIGDTSSPSSLTMQSNEAEWVVTDASNEGAATDRPLIHLFAADQISQSIGVLGAKGRAVSVKSLVMRIDINQWVRLLAHQARVSSHATWPMVIAPFQVHLLPLLAHKSFRVKDLSWDLYQALSQAHVRTLIDDRRERVGAMFATAQEFGAPLQLMVSERGMDAGVLEWHYPLMQEKKDVPVGDVLDLVQSIIGACHHSSRLDCLSEVRVD